MVVELDFRSHIPIYVQIVERIRHLVATDVLKPGEQLPTVRQMAADLRVNFNTIARAYRLLDEAGVISTQQGRGTYVLEPPPPEQARHLRQEALAALTRSFLADADRLSFEPDEIIEIVERMAAQWQQEGALPKDEGESGGAERTTT
jgi:GntR family transcriptional regulator